MTTVTVSSKYQVVIPGDIRDRLKLKPGQKLAVIEKDGIVHLIPIRPLKELKRMAAGTTSKNLRDEALASVRRKIREKRVTREDVSREIRSARKTVREWRLPKALRMIQNGRWSIRRAASFSGL
jgi:AbrB family looped-hinge helix DNA binding protein